MKLVANNKKEWIEVGNYARNEINRFHTWDKRMINYLEKYIQ